MHTLEEIAALLHIHKTAAEHGGAMNNIAGAALGRLRQINEEMKPDAFLEVREPKPEAEPTSKDEPVIERRELGGEPEVDQEEEEVDGA